MKKVKGKIDEKDNMNARQLMPHLPEEIIIEIHSRLPPRSLLKFRCVSKPWSVLYNNPKLIDMIKNNFSIMLISGNDIFSIDNEALSPSSSLLDVIDCRIEKIPHPVALRDIWLWNIEFVGCCNGLFCIRATEWPGDFSLWNPFTGDYQEIPSQLRFQLDKSLHHLQHVVGYGFGYDSKSDVYKLVCFISYLELNQSEVKIYSLRTDSWRRIQHISHLVLSNYHRLQGQGYGVFCNGALHWKSSSSPEALIAFHMTDETVIEISQPENLDFKKFGDGYNTCIDVLNGCLCMLYCNTVYGFEVWMMKDYGKKESWTKIHSISKLTSLRVRWFWRLRRIECLKSGEILLEVYYHSKNGHDRDGLVVYDPKSETFKVLDTKIRPSSFRTYVKSARSVSIN